MRNRWRWWCRCSDMAECQYEGPDAEARAVRSARRHWTLVHLATGAPDTDEARRAAGPEVLRPGEGYGEGRTLDALDS